MGSVVPWTDVDFVKGHLTIWEIFGSVQLIEEFSNVKSNTKDT